ncbi:MAG: type II toxin-antitoxin system VapC family toxin [Candidatus Bilamarchaeaceae archaeon]
MEKICIDFSVALDFLRGDPAVSEKFKYYALKDKICIAAPTVTQLLAVVRRDDLAQGFLNNLVILPYEQKSAFLASKVMHELFEAGVQASFEDIMVAGVCRANGALLYTKNRQNFENIKGLRLV